MIPQITRLNPDSLPECLTLAQDREWLPEKHKWLLLFEVGSVYGLRDEAGGLVGTAILTRFGTELAAISMVLVASRCGGIGLGRTLVTHVLAEAGEATVFLNATELGRPLYEKLDFIPVGALNTHVGDFLSCGEPVRSRPAQPGDFPDIYNLDAQVNGADRTHLMKSLPAFTEGLRVTERHGRVTGYAGAWRNVDSVVIGPVIAECVDDAQALIGDLARAADGPVRVDLEGRHSQLCVWATTHGLPLRKTTAVMVHKGRSLPGDRSGWFSPLNQATG